MSTSTPTPAVDPRYPIGKYQPLDRALTPEERFACTETLRQLPALLSDAVSGLSEAQLDTPYRDGGWTLRQVIHHIADSHSHFNIRIRFAVTGDWPTIQPYDEVSWANLHDARALSIAPSLAVIQGIHARMVDLFSSLSAEDFQTKGFTHPERGRQTLDQSLFLYDWHSRHHLGHVITLRQSKGW